MSVVSAHQRVPDAVDARVRAVARRQAHALPECRAAAGDDDLRAEIHHEPHAEAGGASGVVRARDVVHELGERDVVLRAVAAADLVHQRVAHALERGSRLARAAVDLRQLGGGVTGAVDVLEQQADVARPLRVEPPDLVALPEPWPLLRGCCAAAEGQLRESTATR